MRKELLKSNLREHGYAKESYMIGGKKECSRKQRRGIDIIVL